MAILYYHGHSANHQITSNPPFRIMANFNTHISIAAVSSGLLATAALKMDQIFEPEAVLLTFFGTLGGILPDIDLKYSHPSRIVFTFLGIIAAFASVFALQDQLSIVELWLSAAVTFLLVRYPLWMLFHNYTTHRGAFHSLVAALMFALMVTAAAYHGFNQTALLAWLYGIFMLFGFIIHLLLDELYSVDFMDNKIKSSFGTALKIVDTGQWFSSALITVLAVAFWLATPSLEELSVFTEQETIEKIRSQVLPENGWFGTTVSK